MSDDDQNPHVINSVGGFTQVGYSTGGTPMPVYMLGGSMTFSGVAATGNGTILHGNVYVDISHGLSYTPVINKIVVTPQDNLDGRNHWVNSVGATTFRINISGLDITDDHVFGWIVQL